jgi:hypothetical protein
MGKDAIARAVEVLAEDSRRLLVSALTVPIDESDPRYIQLQSELLDRLRESVKHHRLLREAQKARNGR